MSTSMIDLNNLTFSMIWTVYLGFQEGHVCPEQIRI
jgi:hypothetical protein